MASGSQGPAAAIFRFPVFREVILEFNGVNSMRLPSNGDNLETTFDKLTAASGEIGFETESTSNTWPESARDARRTKQVFRGRYALNSSDGMILNAFANS